MQFAHHSVVKYVKLTKNAETPRRCTPQSIGLDLFSAYDYEINPQERCLIKTDLQIQIPYGCYGRVAPTSRLAYENFIDVGAGVIDPDYRGNIAVLLYNFGKETFKVNKGRKVAQLILEKAMIPIATEVKELTTTQRGQRGLGMKPEKFTVIM